MKKNILNIALASTKRYILFLMISSILCSYITLEIARYIQYTIDVVLFKNNETIPEYMKTILSSNQINNLIIFIIGIVIFNMALMMINHVRNRITSKFKLNIIKNLKINLYKHILNLEYKSYNSTDKEELLQRINDDAEVCASFFYNQFNLILDTIFLGVFIFRESVKMDAIILIYLFIVISIMILFSIWYFKELNIKVDELITKKKKLLKHTLVNINNFKFIRILNKQENEKEKYKKLNNDVTDTSVKVVKLALFYEILSDHITYFNTPILYIICGISVIKGKMTLGALSAIMSLTYNIFNCMLKLGANMESINNFCVTVKRLNKIIKLEEEDNSKEEYDLDGDIIFSNVNIYINKVKVLENLNFIIKRGEKVAIIGDNGSGKSIIAKAMLGFYDYDGNIYINNHNLKRLNKSNIRKYLELILGESYLFSASILENISLLKKHNIEKIEEISKDCEIYYDITRFKEHYKTLIGENGVKLSGGQKQRICIARGLINEKPIIILDEALNKVDNLTKKRILNNMKNKYNNKTIIFISNDLEITNDVDKFIFINRKTTFTGHHTQLIEENTDYNNLIKIKENII